MSDDIVETIDNALDDWTVSPDAVRWTPEKAPEPSFEPDDALAWLEVQVRRASIHAQMSADQRIETIMRGPLGGVTE